MNVEKTVFVIERMTDVWGNIEAIDTCIDAGVFLDYRDAVEAMKCRAEKLLDHLIKEGFYKPFVSVKTLDDGRISYIVDDNRDTQYIFRLTVGPLIGKLEFHLTEKEEG